MPWDAARFVRLRKLKQIKQTELATFAGVTQTRISECQAGQEPSVSVLEKFADRLECTTEFLLHRSFRRAEESDELFRAAASRMAFEVFTARSTLRDEERERCRRVVGHFAAPLTADGWAILAEQIGLAIGPTKGGGAELRSIHGGKPG